MGCVCLLLIYTCGFGEITQIYPFLFDLFIQIGNLLLKLFYMSHHKMIAAIHWACNCSQNEELAIQSPVLCLDGQTFFYRMFNPK